MGGADMVGDRSTAHAVMLADEPAFLTQSEVNEAGIADDDTLQSFQLHAGHRAAPSLANSGGPTLDAILGRIFALDPVSCWITIDWARTSGPTMRVGAQTVLAGYPSTSAGAAAISADIASNT